MLRDKQILLGMALLLRYFRLNRGAKRKKRNALGACHTLVQEMRLTHHKEFFRYFCMSPEPLDHLLSIVGPRLVKDCRSCKPISPGERLAVTIRFLASGDSQRSLYYAYPMCLATQVHATFLPSFRWNPGRLLSYKIGYFRTALDSFSSSKLF